MNAKFTPEVAAEVRDLIRAHGGIPEALANVPPGRQELADFIHHTYAVARRGRILVDKTPPRSVR